MQERVLDDEAPNLEIVEMLFLLFMIENVVNVGHVYVRLVTSSLGRGCHKR